ncbi:MAG TPA: hypothetical protein VF337_04695 [Candidatus Limnocylindrales bacterium]
MRRRLLLPVVALALPLLFAPAAAANTGQTPDTLGETIGWNVALSPTNLLAQTFTTPNKVERLDTIEIFFHGSTNGAHVEAWVKAGAPGLSGIAGTDCANSLSAGWQNAWLTLDPPTSITLAANSQYSIMFSVTDATNTTTIAGEDHPEYYPDGAAYGYDGSTWSTPAPSNSQDLSFQVFMSPVPGTTDQHQNTHDTSVGFAASAQTFTAGVTGTLNAVSLWTDGTDGTQNVTVEICSTTGGIDCGVSAGVAARPALDTGVLASTTLGVNASSSQWYDFALSPAPAIVAGTRYAIVIVGDAGWAGAASNAYGSGAAYGNEAGWVLINGDPVADIAFQTFVTASAVATQPPADATQPPAGVTQPPAGVTQPPTSVAGNPATPNDPNPLPVIFALATAAMVSAVVLTKRYGIASKR